MTINNDDYMIVHFEIVYPLTSEYYGVIDDSVFNSFNFKERAYISRSSKEYCGDESVAETVVKDVTDIMDDEIVRLQKKFEDRHFSKIFYAPASEDSCGTFAVIDDSNGEIVCHAEIFKIDFADSNYSNITNLPISKTLH